MMYDSHEELTDSRTEGLINMVKNNTRSNTLVERIQSVEYCIKNDYNYALAAKEFHVPVVLYNFGITVYFATVPSPNFVFLISVYLQSLYKMIIILCSYSTQSELLVL